MKKLITGMDISDARKAGIGSISVPPGALITPQARDDAKKYGIALVAQATSCPAQPDAAAAPQVSDESIDRVARRLARQTAIAASSDFPHASVSAAAPSTLSAQPDGAALAAEVLKRVAPMVASLGGHEGCPKLQALVNSVIADCLGGEAGASAPASSLAGVSGLDVVRIEKKADVKRVPGEVEVEEAIAPGADGPGVTRLGWADSSFAWTFEFDEVLVVTGGEVEVKSGNSPMAGLVLATGEALRVRAGTSLTLTARGSASCVCSSWPAQA